ncbi:MAG: D-sedoheptulose 7-phosphate isomerase [Proteobacteria bacterium]|nr:D-sedoheptulose 7-phosphate isomerase [Pseudomonadota bacterium]
MDPATYFEAEFDEHEAVAAATRRALSEPFSRMLDIWVSAIEAGNKIVFFGNGGSAGDAQHLATELTVRYKQDRPPIAAIALTTDTSALTAIGNDLGFEQLFARQITALCRPGDVAVAISTSGTSPNIIAGLKEARRLGVVTTALGGKGGGAMVGLADPVLVVPSDTTARIQEMHITLGQMLCGALELRLGLVT